MLGLPRTQGVRSISKVGLSVVTVTFNDDVDLYFARAQVQQRMQDAMGQLPAGAQAMLGPPATAMGEVFEYLVEADSSVAPSDTAALINLTNVQEYTIKPLLRTVPGVADVNTWGGMQQQFQVNADPAKLAGYGLTLSDIESRTVKEQRQLRRGLRRRSWRAVYAARTWAGDRHRRRRQRRARDSRRHSGAGS